MNHIPNPFSLASELACNQFIACLTNGVRILEDPISSMSYTLRRTICTSVLASLTPFLKRYTSLTILRMHMKLLFICIIAIALSSCQVTRHVDSEDVNIVVSPMID